MKNTIYGYCRISRKTQNIERQSRNIKSAFPDAVIVNEAWTGTNMDRPQWTKLCKKVKSGDTIIFDSVSRMSRNAEEGFQAYEDFVQKGVELVFLKERYIDTETYKKAQSEYITLTGTAVDYILEGINKYMTELKKEQIRIAFEQAEKEVADLHQRTKEGMKTAELNGKQIGAVKGAKFNVKKSGIAKELILKYSKAFDGNLADEDVLAIIQKQTSLTRKTYYKYKKELKQQKEGA